MISQSWVIIDLKLPIQYCRDEERKLCRYPVSVADFGSARKPPALLQNWKMTLKESSYESMMNCIK